MNIGILGAGNIASTMAKTLNSMKGVKCRAVASRDLARAKNFALEHRIQNAYGSYEELASDPAIDIIYIATPHSHHAEHAKLCIEHGKAVLCEKAFAKNAAEAKSVLDFAKEKNVLVTEAIWTRYMPSRKLIDEILVSSIIGKITSLSANLHYNIYHKERLVNPALAGGALLDVGIYTLNFALMHFGAEIERVESSAALTETGVDGTNSITLYYPDGRTAFLNSGMFSRSDRKGIFFGERGYIVVENINNPNSICVFDERDNLVKKVEVPPQISGYEYEVEETVAALSAKKIECDSMPHRETLRVMEIMDSLRKSWGVKFPGE